MARHPANADRHLTEEGSLSLYFKEIAGNPPISKEESALLAEKIRGGDRAALHRLVEANLRFVVSVCRNYQNQGLPLSDLINEGNLGLIRAAHHFDEKKNFKFISYAVWWIRQAILQALSEQSRIVRLPVNRSCAIHKIGKTQRKLEQKYRRTPTAEEIARELEIAETEVCEVLKIGNSHASLDAPIDAKDDCRLIDLLQDRSQEQPDEAITTISLREEIGKSLDALTKREKKVIELYFGIGHETAHTLDEIGEHINVTRERVRQIKEKALSRLRHASLGARLQTLQ
jgi:RNA polymerase primary sigma factor